VILVSSIAAWLVFRTDSEVIYLMTVLISLAAAGNSLKPLASLQTQLAEADAAATRVLELTSLPVEPSGTVRPAGQSELPRHTRSARVENIVYHYPTTDAPALNDLSLALPFGATIALVGCNGSGKPTLLSMIPSLLHPT